MARAAPIGAIVRLYVDASEEIAKDDFLRTPSGRLYHVLGGRVQQRGKHRGRNHLTCQVVESTPPRARVHDFSWYPRDPTGPGASQRAAAPTLPGRGDRARSRQKK